jgi:alpha-tubulin suppressor-like RCC1 family protein
VLESRRGVIEPFTGAVPATGSEAWAQMILECPRPLRVDVDAARSVAVGVGHACALGAGGSVRCWGSNQSGELGDGTTVDRPRPVVVQALAEATAIAAGGFHTCAVTTSRDVFCWGDNQSGALGDGTTESRSKPVRVEGVVNAVAIACGTAFSCAEIDDGEVYCWGSGSFGQLGDGGTRDSPRPRRVRAPGGR